MQIAKRLAQGIMLPLALAVACSPAFATGTLQCVPYAREISGVSIRGDAWTWWDQARGHYARGNDPRPGAVIALANTDVMPLGHVAVVSKVLDERHILLRHANWSGPGLIEKDVLAVDTSVDNDWSQVRIWWGQAQQMGARDNPVNGFIYPQRVSEKAVFDPGDLNDREMPDMVEAPQPRFVRTVMTDAGMTPRRGTSPRLSVDPELFRVAQDNMLSSGLVERTLAMIVHDVRREARLP